MVFAYDVHVHWPPIYTVGLFVRMKAASSVLLPVTRHQSRWRRLSVTDRSRGHHLRKTSSTTSGFTSMTSKTVLTTARRRWLSSGTISRTSLTVTFTTRRQVEHLLENVIVHKTTLEKAAWFLCVIVHTVLLTWRVDQWSRFDLPWIHLELYRWRLL